MNNESNPRRMDNLKRLRKEKGFTCESLGTLVGVKKSAMSKYERGEIQPSNHVLKNIADVLGCTVDYLLGRESAPERRAPAVGVPQGVDVTSEMEEFKGLTPSEIRALSKIARIFKEQRDSVK